MTGADVVLVGAGERVEPTESMRGGWRVGKVPDCGFAAAAAVSRSSGAA